MILFWQIVSSKNVTPKSNAKRALIMDHCYEKSPYPLKSSLNATTICRNNMVKQLNKTTKKSKRGIQQIKKIKLLLKSLQQNVT